jgi:hypothetical protein
MRNKITDLNNHLFAQLERLNDEQLKGDKLAQEIERGKAVAAIAQQIVVAAKVTVDAAKLLERTGKGITKNDLQLIYSDGKS